MLSKFKVFILHIVLTFQYLFYPKPGQKIDILIFSAKQIFQKKINEKYLDVNYILLENVQFDTP